MTEQNGLGRSATERLRELLDERGVEYRFNESTKVFEWHFEGTDGEGSAHATEVNGGINIIACSLTPEQAIEATLGRETCEVEGSYEDPLYLQQVYQLSCGHEVMWEYAVAPDFCPWCGRRVVE